MASFLHITPLDESAAQAAVRILVKALLAPCHGEEADKRTAHHVFEIAGFSIDALYERSPSTRTLRAINFDVTTPAGPVRCGSSALMAAALVWGLSNAPKKGKK
jgi:hypothetical protein